MLAKYALLTNFAKAMDVEKSYGVQECDARGDAMKNRCRVYNNYSHLNEELSLNLPSKQNRLKHGCGNTIKSRYLAKW